MSANARPVIVRRKKADKTYHGGNWKLAFADFMTAMMALFLVFWLLAVSTPQQLQDVGEYFRRPLVVALAGGDKSTASTSVIPGGGTDPVHSEGEVARIDQRLHTRPADVQRHFVDLQRRIRELMIRDPEFRELSSQLRTFMVPEGLLIQLVDSERKPMYALGSDKVEPYMSNLLQAIAPMLNDLPYQLIISGHTDSIQYRARDRSYSNWELSADRANAARRELVAGGFESRKLLRVIGMADQVPLPETKANDPVNRRIELVLLDPEVAALLGQPYRNSERKVLDGHK